jgi:hypothetical protein
MRKTLYVLVPLVAIFALFFAALYTGQEVSASAPSQTSPFSCIIGETIITEAVVDMYAQPFEKAQLNEPMNPSGIIVEKAVNLKEEAEYAFIDFPILMDAWIKCADLMAATTPASTPSGNGNGFEILGGDPTANDVNDDPSCTTNTAEMDIQATGSDVDLNSTLAGGTYNSIHAKVTDQLHSFFLTAPANSVLVMTGFDHVKKETLYFVYTIPEANALLIANTDFQNVNHFYDLYIHAPRPATCSTPLSTDVNAFIANNYTINGYVQYSGPAPTY